MIVVMLLLLIPMAGAAQQSTDIKKPTRSRVTEKDKNTKNKASNNNTANTKDTKNNQTTDKNDNKKPAAKVADTQAVKPNPATPKADDKKTADAAAKPDAAKPANDTAAKPVTPAKPKRVPVDPNKVQFDGIDVSKHQGNINWEELRKNSKIQFVYIKATEGSNYVDINFVIDERTGRIIMIGALDNLVKGAAGQAVQNMNIMFGIDEATGLNQIPMCF